MPRDQSEASASDPHTASIMKNVEQGAATTVWAAVASTLEGRGGKYLEDCCIATAWDRNSHPFGPGYGPWAYEEDKAMELWAKSLELIG